MTPLRSRAAEVLAALLTGGLTVAQAAAAEAPGHAAAPVLVELAINTSPPAVIEVDGEPTGLRSPIWPGSGLRLPLGRHEIVFVTSDGTRHRYVVTLEPGDTAKRLIIKRLGGPPGGDVMARLARPEEIVNATSLPRTACAGIGPRLLGEKRYQEAAIEFEAALAADPQCLGAHRGLGIAYARLGKHQLASQHFVLYVESESGTERSAVVTRPADPPRERSIPSPFSRADDLRSPPPADRAAPTPPPSPAIADARGGPPEAQLRDLLRRRTLTVEDAKLLWPDQMQRFSDPRSTDAERQQQLARFAADLDQFQFTRRFIDGKMARAQRTWAAVRPRMNQQSSMFRDLEAKQQKMLAAYAAAADDPSRLADVNKLINELELATRLAAR